MQGGIEGGATGQGNRRGWQSGTGVGVVRRRLTQMGPGQLAVVKTKPGYASAIAWDIDNKATDEVLGTIAGDDTILVIPREGISRADILQMMNHTFAEKDN